MPSGRLVVYVRREPLGVVLTITPRDVPLFTTRRNVFPATAAGNAVVLKPPEHTSLTSLLFGKLAGEAGLPLRFAGRLRSGPNGLEASSSPHRRW